MAEEIQVLSAGAVQPGLLKVIEAFRCETGNDVKVTFATAPELRKRLGSGESADVVIAPPELLDDLVEGGKAQLTDRVTVGRIGVGVMVRDGAPLPKITTVEEFTQSVLDADSIVYNQASTGLYIESLFKRLGIAGQLEAEITRYADFAAVHDHVSKGHGKEIGFGATTVIIESAGERLKFVGPLPAEIQNYTTYVAALIADAGDAARALVSYLASPAAKAILADAGIE